MDSNISSLIDRMLEWRQFPHYRLEFRADAILSFAMPALIKYLFRDVGELSDTMIPEFPLPQRVLNKECEHYRSERLDYALFSSDLKSLFIVELKTDGGSFRPTQTQKMENLTALSSGQIGEWFSLLEVLKRRTKQKRKYDHLLDSVRELYSRSSGLSAPEKVYVLFLSPKPPKGKCDSEDGRVKWCTFEGADRILSDSDIGSEVPQMALHLVKRLSEIT